MIEKIILEDLNRYLEEKGVDTVLLLHSDILYIAKCFRRIKKSARVGYSYTVANNALVPLAKGRPIFSLADPQYKEKFCEYLKRVEEEGRLELPQTGIIKWMK